MKGIILAGGTGSRLWPMTLAVSKQMLPVYDKPMVYYPLSILMLAGIREILLISTPSDLPKFKELLDNGSQWGVHIEYEVQEKPDGLPQALLIGREFIASTPVCLVLGDNILHGDGLSRILQSAGSLQVGCSIFGYRVLDPERYGVIEIDRDGNVCSIEEKPLRPRSNLAIPGLYFFDEKAVAVAAQLRPSSRGELEITDMIKHYLRKGQLTAHILGRGTAWFDAGTPDAMLDAASYVATIEKRQGLKIACPEEIGFSHGWISLEQLDASARRLRKNAYAEYITRIVAESEQGRRTSGEVLVAETVVPLRGRT